MNKPTLAALKRNNELPKKLFVLLAGQNGSGKTITSMKMMAKAVGPEGKIAVIDTLSQAHLHLAAMDNPGQFDIFPMVQPDELSPSQWLDMAKQLIAVGNEEGETPYAGVIIDTISEHWGSTLDTIAKLPSSKRMDGWNDITPIYEKFFVLLKSAQFHVILNAQVEYRLKITPGKDGAKQEVVQVKKQIQRLNRSNPNQYVNMVMTIDWRPPKGTNIFVNKSACSVPVIPGDKDRFAMLREKANYYIANDEQLSMFVDRYAEWVNGGTNANRPS